MIESTLVLKSISKFTTRHPFVWKGAVTGTLFYLADLITQLWVERKTHLDINRNVNFLIIGLLNQGPLNELWYSILLPILTKRYFSTLSSPLKILSAQLFADCVIYAPITYICLYGFKILLE